MSAFSSDDLREGDVLLYRGTSPVSQLIIQLDGGPYSHAAIYHDEQVLEALEGGVTARSLEASTDGVPVDVYRFVSNNHFLGDPPLPVEPVAEASAWFAGNGQRYAYEEVLLLAVLCGSRRLSRAVSLPGLAWILRTVLDRAAAVVAEIAAAGKEPVICSELVYRIYGKAGDAYRIHVRGVDAPLRAVSAVGQPENEDVEAFLTAARDFLVNYGALKAPALDMKVSPGSSFLEAEKQFTDAAVADFVTPHDLKESPNLQLRGTLFISSTTLV